MKFLFKIVVLFLLFIYSILFFAPKELAYNLLEEKLQVQKLIISDEKREELPLGLAINNSKIFYDGLEVAKIDSFNINLFLFLNTVEVKNIKLLDSFSQMFPSSISSVTMKHDVLNIDKFMLEGNGEFGEFDGYIDLVNRKIYIELLASKLMKTSYTKILKKMRNEKGVYTYEYKF